MSFAGARVLITGGLGFIGSNLARRLVHESCDVVIMDSLIPAYGGNPFNIEDIRDQIEVHYSDVRDRHSIRALVQGVDYVFNLAGQTSHLDSMTDPFTDLDINAAAQLSILEACREGNPGAKIVFASTRQIYGRPDYLPVDESHPIRPVDVNGINKAAGESYHLLYNSVYGIQACALRLTNTYGPGMRVKDARQTFLGIWIKQVLTGEPIKVFGDGLQKRDFTYVDDCVDALLLAGANPAANGHIYNLGSSEIIALGALAELLIDVAGQGSFELVPFPADRKQIDIGDYYGSSDLIAADLGWEPSVTLREGLTRTLEYYRAHADKYWAAT
ncbi:MAG: NAD-dependent epimerase/dehydratase family protein [bacterium]|nr:NAD-dependent epimerase/dehydratase family protein [bacterium]